MKYPAGTELIFRDIHHTPPEEIRGVVVENVKLPGDICVKWESGEIYSYDEQWLDEFTEITGS